MRYSPLQEDSFGQVGLGQETPPRNDNSMMDAAGEIESAGTNPMDEGSMVSNLPLLFASGYPTSLDKVNMVGVRFQISLLIRSGRNKIVKYWFTSQVELERFVAFMLQCSRGNNNEGVITQPQWWPKEVKFSVPVERPKKFSDSVSTLC